MNYDWNLMLRLLREVQRPGDAQFAPRRYAEDHAMALEDQGQAVPDLDHLRSEATVYESRLVDGHYIEPRPEVFGGNGENYILTERGGRLLHLLEDDEHAGEIRRVLDQKGSAALAPEVFDTLYTTLH